ncbi:hypothetical protein ACQ4PT_042731 [Festuca glaucescens]
MDLVRSLGADEVMDYKTPEGASLQSPSGKKYDGVVHCTVGVSWSTFRPLLSSRGRVIDLTPNLSAILASGLHKVTFAKKRVVPLFLRLNKADLEFLVGLLEEGKAEDGDRLEVPAERGKQSKAWQASIDGHPTGKIVVEMEG